jgi:hypothetical protein
MRCRLTGNLIQHGKLPGMRKIFYGLMFVVFVNMLYTACKCRYNQPMLIPTQEFELLPSTNSLQKLPEW